MPGPLLNMPEDNAEPLLQQCGLRPSHHHGIGSSPPAPPCYGARPLVPHPAYHHYPSTPTPPYPPQQAGGCYPGHAPPPPPNPAYHYINEQRRRQKLKREIVLAAFDALPVATLPSSRGEAARVSSPTALQRYMATRTLPPHPFWENVALLQSNPSILHFIRDFGRCDWMEVDCATMTVRMSSASLEQLRLTDELLVQWLRYYDPTLPFWTLFATLATYSGFMVGKLVGHLRNIEANTGAKVWVAPRDPDATFVSFFICGKTEECTMLAFHALQARELAALSLGEKLGSNSPGEEESPCSGGSEAQSSARSSAQQQQPPAVEEDEQEEEQAERPEEEEEGAAASSSAPEGPEEEAEAACGPEAGSRDAQHEASAGGAEEEEGEEVLEEAMGRLALGRKTQPQQPRAKKNEAARAAAMAKNHKKQPPLVQQQQGGAARPAHRQSVDAAPEVVGANSSTSRVEDDVRAA